MMRRGAPPPIPATGPVAEKPKIPTKRPVTMPPLAPKPALNSLGSPGMDAPPPPSQSGLGSPGMSPPPAPPRVDRMNGIDNEPLVLNPVVPPRPSPDGAPPAVPHRPAPGVPPGPPIPPRRGHP